MWQRTCFLLSLEWHAFLEQFLSHKPFQNVHGMSQMLLIQEILECEYGPHTMKEIGHAVLTVNERGKK